MEEMIWINHFEESKYVRKNVHILEDKFKQIAKIGHPKIVTLHEAQEAGITKTKGMWNGIDMSMLDEYGAYWLDKGYSADTPTGHKGWMDWMAGHDNNRLFHACKIQWLVNAIKTEGLYSVPQAKLLRDYWFVHPGQFRVHALEYTDYNEEFIVWDIKEKLRQPEITWDEWWCRYEHHYDKALFAVVFDDIVEMHVGEYRNEMYDTVIEGVNTFQGQKPILQGTCDERLKDLFNHGTYEGHGIGIEGHFEVEDLRHIMDFMPKKEFVVKENFVLYNNYHK